MNWYKKLCGDDVQDDENLKIENVQKSLSKKHFKIRLTRKNVKFIRFNDDDPLTLAIS